MLVNGLQCISHPIQCLFAIKGAVNHDMHDSCEVSCPLQVPIRNLLRMATSTSPLPSLPSQQGKVDSQLAGVPLSAWALANLVYLAADSATTNGHFVKGLVSQEYVQALYCLLEDLNPWIETTRKRRKAERNANEDEDNEAVDGTKSVGVG